MSGGGALSMTIGNEDSRLESAIAFNFVWWHKLLKPRGTNMSQSVVPASNVVATLAMVLVLCGKKAGSLLEKYGILTKLL
eukprot:5983716-Ditylum_brightwellii.AAC.1